MRKSVVFALALATMFFLGTSNAGAGNGPIDYCLDTSCSCESLSCETLKWTTTITNACGANVSVINCTPLVQPIGVSITNGDPYPFPPGGTASASATFDSPPGEYATGIECGGEAETGVPVSSGPEPVFCGLCTVAPCPIDVYVDIRPQSCPNPLNANAKGVLPVAILTTDDFDATTVDPASVRLEGVAPMKWEVEDVTTPFNGPSVEECYDCTDSVGDGALELTLKFDAQAVVNALGGVQDGDCLPLQLTGTTYDGIPITGGDYVLMRVK